jgi:large conductance mechanosensitive channel
VPETTGRRSAGSPRPDGTDIGKVRARGRIRPEGDMHMKNLINEFKDFINKGDVVTIAVGLVMALYFKLIVDAVIDGVITPIIAAIFGKSDIFLIGFDIGDSRISIGAVLYAALVFVVVAFILFMVVKAYNAWKAGDGADDEVEAAPTEVELLTQIRDSLQNR